MKIAIASDLHLEFEQIVLTNDTNADVLVLAGDIVTAEAMKRFPFGSEDRNTGSIHEICSKRYEEFFYQISNEFPLIVVIMGNHEHYSGTFNNSYDIIKRNLATISDKIILLEKERLIIDDVMFIGATLWTNMKHGDPLVRFDVQRGMSDFHVIKYNNGTAYSKLNPSIVMRDHDYALSAIKLHSAEARELNLKTVVITHHAPSWNSVATRFLGGNLNYAYYTDLHDFIELNTNINVWFHGHMHDEFDYVVGETRVMCNPRGYPQEISNRHNETFGLKTIEV
jgi:predicted phosphodiesterase